MKSSYVLKIVFAAALSFFPLLASAGTEHNLTGWAWSSNVGWISMNCTNDGTCAVVDYGVNENSDGTLTGYAWSSAVGWIQFGGLSGFPNGSGTQSFNAQVNGNNLQGWAKAIGADNNGWDGWISLSGSGYGVNQSGSTFVGYAWGSNVIGWIQFDVDAQNPGLCTSTCGVRLSGDATLDVKSGGVSIAGNTSVPYGTIPTFEWTITNLPGVSCSISKTSTGGTSFTTVSGITSSGSTTGNALTQAAYTFALNCTNPTISKSVSFTVAAQPPGFSIGNADGVRIQILNTGTADSEQDSIFVTAVGGFANPVTVSVTNGPTGIASTTYLYSLGGGTFSGNPTPVVITSPYNAGSTLKVRVTRLAGAPALAPFTVTLTGTATGATSAQKTVTVTPVTFNPLYEER